jgi:hypothetical protein
MNRCLWLLASALLPVGALAACGGRADTHPSTEFHIALHGPDGARPAFVEVTGLSSADLGSVDTAHWARQNWQALLTVSVVDNGAVGAVPPVQGRYGVTGSGVTFVPAFPFDPGRSYTVTFDPSALPQPRGGGRTTVVVSLPAAASELSTVVTAIHPASEVLSENTLRLYIEFSAPMGNGGALDHVRLSEPGGSEVSIPFLPVETSFWNADHTRYTLFFDPGRVKQGILPNQQLGRPLRAGRRYVLEISPEWRDARNQPLKQGFRREFRVGPARIEALSMAAWRIAAPEAGTRDPLVVTFPAPLDHGLLGRALSVESQNGRAVDGQIALEEADSRWLFRPHAPWTSGIYRLAALSVLEDPAGNRIGRAFEVDMTRARPEPAPDTYRMDFRVGGSGP